MFSVLLILCSVTAYSPNVMDVTFSDCRILRGKPIHATLLACAAKARGVEEALNAPAKAEIRKQVKFPYTYPKRILRTSQCHRSREV